MLNCLLSALTTLALVASTQGQVKQQGTASTDFTQNSVLTTYFSNDDLELHMRSYIRRCGHMSRMFSIGQSKQGRQMYALELSSSPGRIEPKPNARFVGNMHGDEPASRQLLLGLAEWLCQHHATNAQAAKIVDDMHLYIVPTVNPDGFEHKLRHNLGEVDLNRDFPDPLLLGSKGLQPSGHEQPETLALMEWTTHTHFVASASMHEGAIVANYPWDGLTDPNTTYSKSPDDDAFRYLASVYADAHTDMHNSQEFAGGITNGAHWYPLTGGMQDFAYVKGQCMELTIELSQNKWPPEDELPGLFDANLPAMLAFPLAAAFSGLRGRVHGTFTSNATEGTATEQPLPATTLVQPLPATILVQGIDHSIEAGPLGDYYRPLAPGMYHVSASMKGYRTAAMQVVIPSNGSGVVHDFVLPCVTCSNTRMGFAFPAIVSEQGIHARTAFYALIVLAAGCWLLYSAWLWYQARHRRMAHARRNKPAV